MREIINKQKAPKDTVLNNIMKEIGEEHGIVVDDNIASNTTPISSKKKTKRSWLRLFFYVLLMVIVLLVFLVLYIITIDATQNTSQHTLPSSSHTHIVVPIKDAKPTEKSSKNINMIVKKEEKILKLQQASPTVSLEETEESLLRKKAKAALMEQMRN